MEEEEYERLEGVGVAGSMFAGAFAGTAEHIVMYPIDSVKTRMQALKCEKKLNQGGIFRNVVTMMKEEGLTRPMRGATVVITGAGPAHALYFASYEQIKKLLFARKVSYLPESAVQASAGAVATLFHDAVMTPAEAVKQRMQMCCSKHRRWTSCAKSIYSEEGPRAFFRAYSTQLTMNVPYQMCQFVVYERCKKIFNPEGSYNPKAHLMSGAIAGAFAASVTNPLDVCKTLLNTQEPQLLRELNTPRIVGMLQALSTVYRVAGVQGYFKGLSARILFQAPSTAICWATYEFMKNVLAIAPLRHGGAEDKFDTLADLTSSTTNPHHGGSSHATSAASEKGAGSGKGGGGLTKDDHKLLDMITDMPRPSLQALEEAWGAEKPETSPLKYSDTNFPPIRTNEVPTST